MMQWVLETRYQHLFHAVKVATESILIEEAGESNLIDMMNAILMRYPDIRLSSLPKHIPGGRQIEFSLSGNPGEVPAAMAEARAEVTRLGYTFTNL
jgi:molybdopterin-biosynthesis enzyme MoeA-like protein